MAGCMQLPVYIRIFTGNTTLFRENPGVSDSLWNLAEMDMIL